MNTGLPDGEDAISVTRLAEWRQAGMPHSILDVREADELAMCRIDSAMHIPIREVPARLTELPVDAPLVVMCHHGMRSRQVVNFLRSSGRLNAVNLDGGIDAWAREIDPSVRLY